MSNTNGMSGEDALVLSKNFTKKALETGGGAGFSPKITENADNTDTDYKLDIETADGTFTTPNLMANVTVDSSLSYTSYNAIQNRAVTNKFDKTVAGEVYLPVSSLQVFYVTVPLRYQEDTTGDKHLIILSDSLGDLIFVSGLSKNRTIKAYRVGTVAEPNIKKLYYKNLDDYYKAELYIERTYGNNPITIYGASGASSYVQYGGVTGLVEIEIENVSSASIIDEITSANTTWSSEKIASELGGKVYTSLAELGLDTTATINDIVGAMADGSQFTYKTDVFDYATEYNNIQYGTVTIHKQSAGRVQVLMTDKDTGNLYVGRMDNSNKFVGWRNETFHRVVAQGIAGYFKFKPTSTGIDQPLRISVTDNYGGMINISGATPSASQYKPFKCIRLSNGEYTNYDAIKVANNKMLKLFYYDGYFYLKVTTYTTCTFTGLIEAPTYVETFDEENAEQIPIRSVFDTPYNDGYADPSIIVIGDADSSDGVIKTLSTLGFTEDIMTWDTGVYRVSHVGGLTNFPAEITEEKPGFRLEHYDMKKWGSNHNPNISTYGCRQSVLHYKGNIFVRYTESGATAGVLITDTGWRKIGLETITDLAELGLTSSATLNDVYNKLGVGQTALLSVQDFNNYQTLFPYSVDSDKYARVEIHKGASTAHSRVMWFMKNGSRMALGNVGSGNTIDGWVEYTTKSYVDSKVVTPVIKAAAGSNINTVGTPTVTASTSGTTTTFTFNNLKGATGSPGAAGATPLIHVNGMGGSEKTMAELGPNEGIIAICTNVSGGSFFTSVTDGTVKCNGSSFTTSKQPTAGTSYVIVNSGSSTARIYCKNNGGSAWTIMGDVL